MSGGADYYLPLIEDRLKDDKIFNILNRGNPPKVDTRIIKICYPSRKQQGTLWFARGRIVLRSRTLNTGEQITKVKISLRHVNWFWLVLLTIITSLLFLIVYVPKINDLIIYIQEMKYYLLENEPTQQETTPEPFDSHNPSYPHSQVKNDARLSEESEMFEETRKYCPYCGGLIDKNLEGEMVCTSCGTSI